MKINSAKAFREAVDSAFETQELRDARKLEYDALHKDFAERHDALCDYAEAHPEVFDEGECGRSREGTTDRVRYKMTTGEVLERIDGGRLTDEKWLKSLPARYVRNVPTLKKQALKDADLKEEELLALGLRRVVTRTMKLKPINEVKAR